MYLKQKNDNSKCQIWWQLGFAQKNLSTAHGESKDKDIKHKNVARYKDGESEEMKEENT